MQQPTINEYDAWRHSITGKWFFDHVLTEYVRLAAIANGKGMGTYLTKDEDHMTCVRNAGHITGVEYVIDIDPLADEREALNESKGSG